MDLNTLIVHLADQAPGFAARLARAGLAAGDVHAPEHLNAIPVLRKDDLVDTQADGDLFGGFLACHPADLRRIYQSPGPIYDPEPARPDYWRWAPALRAAGFGHGDLVLNTFSYHLTPAGAMFEEGLRAVGCAVIPGGVGNQEQQVRALYDLGVSGYVGLPSYLKSLMDRAESLNLSLKLAKAFVTAEPLPPSLRHELNDRGVTVRQGYGTAECGNLGFECEQEAGWHIPEGILLQICDLNSGQPVMEGESGEIVVTLDNPDYALVRFGTGDLSALNAEPCPCGLPTARLVGWLGRVGEAVKVRGMFLHPNQLRGMMARFPEVLRWQVVISRREHKDDLTMRIVTAPGVQFADLKDRITRRAREAIKFRLAVEAVPEEALPEDVGPFEDTRSWD